MSAPVIQDLPMLQSETKKPGLEFDVKLTRCRQVLLPRAHSLGYLLLALLYLENGEPKKYRKTPPWLVVADS